jgi:hypothetical protein
MSNRANVEDAANEAHRRKSSHHGQRPDIERSDSTSSTEERQPGGIPAIGKAMEPLTQPLNAGIKGTTRAVNGTVGVATSVTNGLISGATSVIGYTAEATLPKGVCLIPLVLINFLGLVLMFRM